MVHATLEATTGQTVTTDSLAHSAALLRAAVKIAASPEEDHIQDVLEMTVQGHGPEAISKAVGLDRDDLAHTVKSLAQRFRTRREAAPDLYGTALFPIEPDTDTLEKLTPQQREVALAEAEELRASNPLPYSWQLEFPEVGVRKAVAALRSKTSIDQDLTSLALRVRASQQAPSTGLITFATLRATWTLVQLGQFDRVVRDPDLPARAAESILVAYESLETARSDSVAAMQQLRNNPDPSSLDTLTVRARPLAEAAVRRLERILASTSTGLDTFRLRGIDQFLHETADLPLPQHVGELHEGQVHRIGLMLGLTTEPISDKALAAAEEQLKGKDLEADIPWLKGLWISAVSCNREPRFWQAISLLLDGDPEWTSPLS